MQSFDFTVKNSRVLESYKVATFKGERYGCTLSLLFTIATLCLALYSSLISAEISMVEDKHLSAQQWLKKMQAAEGKENYRGTFVFMRGPISSTMSVVHRYQQGVEQERLKQLDGAMGEIIRTGTEVMCVFPDRKVVQIEQSPTSKSAASIFANFMPEQSEYDVSILGVDRMIERSCIKLGITAMDNDRYSYRLWLDQATGLLLKSTMLNAKGEELERFQYTQVEFPERIIDQELQAMNQGEVITHEVMPAIKAEISWPDKMMWEAGWTPKGYMKVNGAFKSGKNVMVFSDGLASYSVFVEALKNDAMPEGASQVGATIAYSHQKHYDEQQYNITVIGEIPAMTAMKIAESVQAVSAYKE